jgi:hypothetical protein
MKQRILILAAAAGVALSLALGALGPAAAQLSGDCLSPREIQDAVASGAIVTVDEAMSADGITQRPLGQAQVCRRDGNLEYYVNIMDKNGATDTKVLNAQDG